jgi:hypothetical protein
VDRPPNPCRKATEYAEDLLKAMPEWVGFVATIAEAKKITGYRMSEAEAKLIGDAGMVFAIILYSFDCTFTDPDAQREENFYYQLNARLRKRDPKFLSAAHGFLFYLMTGLFRLRPYRGTLYRGIDVDKAGSVRKKFQVGMRLSWAGFNSATPDLDIAKSFAGEDGVILRIKTLEADSNSRDIRNLSAIPGESEVLLLPNIELFVANVSAGIIDLIEVRPAGILQDF